MYSDKTPHPYAERLRGKIVVAKYGGELMKHPHLDCSAEDISEVSQWGIKLIIAHGGGPQMNELSEELGMQPFFINGERVTNEAERELAKMVLRGITNIDFVAALQKYGCNAVGLSGVDGRSVYAKQRPKESGLEYVGDVTQVNIPFLGLLLGNGYVPVFSSLAYDGYGNALNVNADTFAKDLARAVKADKLVIATNVDGVYRDQNDPSSLVSCLSLQDARCYVEQNIASGGMGPKLRACILAVEGGVKRAHIINGTKPHALSLELGTLKGTGTMVVSDVAEYEKELMSQDFF